MHLQSTRCLVRPFEESDLDCFMVYRNNLDWMKHQGFKGLSKEAYQQALLKEQALNDGAQFAIIRLEDNQLIGDIYLKEEEAQAIWIGYTITPSFARQGYAEETVRSVIDQLAASGYSLVKAGVEPSNAASVHLLKKLGFTFIGMDTSEEEEMYHLKLPIT
ncbi:GNAT family N-acetyltransferase [Candidatus Enterococcus clewellii]|uniref:N-acetyltransferase domain-containing protein n=1 Tax=Candidatus Enterococcus clewellii TaxID=1834193 RepID=A0A242K4Q5_9ENTE|nr:GNAT family N-acetyltransferase [Enterococcus sp. 9E7_DIV0242]OTP14425.1 hypothetical protein A5888_002526 [Enterococcus sp. 9E7_DIV0242]